MNTLHAGTFAVMGVETLCPEPGGSFLSGRLFENPLALAYTVRDQCLEVTVQPTAKDGTV
jgi:hypothetical protein